MSPADWPPLLAGIALGAFATAWWLLRRQADLEAMGQRALRAAGQQVEAAEARTHHLAARLKAVEHLVPEALVFVSPEGTVAGASPAAIEWFDLDALDQTRAPSAMAVLRSAELNELVARGRDGETEPLWLRHLGRTLSARAAPLPDGGVVLALRDETELERLVRARRDLVANVSHDLRTPLTSIGLMVEALSDGADNSPELIHTMLARIAEQVATVNTLVAGIVDLDRLESGHAVFQLRPTALEPIVRAAIASLQAQVEHQGVQVSAAVDPGLRVLADGPSVQRALTNVLDNAVRFSPPGGRVTVEAQLRADAERVEIVVADEGPGIAPADLDRIFERFYRSDRSRSGGGAGLGLAIARHIVEGHGGTISAGNRPHGGTEIRLTLPSAD
jgi:two-component system, OmpR family, phosphate regulon sensor histidine kinase PhoR